MEKLEELQQSTAKLITETELIIQWCTNEMIRKYATSQSTGDTLRADILQLVATSQKLGELKYVCRKFLEEPNEQE